MREYGAAIIGAGASGLMAAWGLGKIPGGTVLLECNDKPGKKLLATGNGRCNLSNREICAEHYHGGADWIDELLKSWPAKSLQEEFLRLGLLTCADQQGRIYPRSYQAASVLRGLWSGAVRQGAEIVCGFSAGSIRRKKSGGFIIKSESGESVAARCCVLACGGMASPRHTKASGSGYDLAKSMGHSVTKLSPALTGLRVRGIFGLKGNRCRARVSLVQRGRELCGESGEVIFGDGSISGICVMNMSSRLRGLPSGGLTLVLDLFEDMARDELAEYLYGLCAAQPDRPAGELLYGAVNLRLGEELVKAAGVPSSKKLSQLSQKELGACAAVCKAFRLSVEGPLSWEQAQVTAGGVATGQIDPATMESRLCPGLFIVGELLDVDGDCGGYNLHFAFAGGLAAARGIRDKIGRGEDLDA